MNDVFYKLGSLICKQRAVRSRAKYQVGKMAVNIV